jgi:Tol biopolymer transport system component
VSRHGVAAVSLAIALGVQLGTAQATFPGRNGEIAFSRFERGHWQIYVGEPSGRHVRRLTHGPHDSYSPAYSADGERIAFTQERSVADRYVYDVAVMDDDGRHVRRLGRGSSPQFRPDGRRIAFGCDRGVCTMNADGSHVRLLARHGGSPAYSPDGRRIVFKGDYGENRGIFVVNADGTHRRQLTRSPSTRTTLWTTSRIGSTSTGSPAFLRTGSGSSSSVRPDGTQPATAMST